MAVEMWRQGISHKVFRTLNHIGITLGVDATRNYVDLLGKAHDQDLKVWRENLKVSLLMHLGECNI